jgi:hypothetical protein
MKGRFAGAVVSLLLLVPGVAAAQGGPEDCTIAVELFDSNSETCVVTVVPDDTTKLAALKAAQARWDSLAKDMGVAAALLWLGPRPKTVNDIWWVVTP